jgi:shikimate dehydrogenase
MEIDLVPQRESRYRAAVLGHPISHSLSPALHCAVFKEYELDCSYSAIDVTEDQLAEFISRMDASWVGLSLTMPLKEKILELIGGHNELVRLTQSANTVYRLPTGDLALENTDIFGIENAVRESGFQLADQVLIIGSGATARSAVVAAHNLGAKTIKVQARNALGRQTLVNLISEIGLPASSGDIDLAEIHKFDLVISTVPPGSLQFGDMILAASSNATLLDVTYSPWPSALADWWPNQHIVSGMEMLLWQATRQVELFYGVSAPVGVMRTALVGN